MADVFSKKKRSEVMSRIRSRGNEATEIALVKLFRRNKITGWRRNQKVFGKPDFVFPKLRLAVFVDGCFWHGCPKHGTQPKGNRTFWKNKFVRNIARDRLVNRTLRSANWCIMRIWQHELTRKNETRLLQRFHRKKAFIPISPSRGGRNFPGDSRRQRLFLPFRLAAKMRRGF